MRKNSPVKGRHGLAARGQGKPLYYHTQIPHAEQQPQDPARTKRRRPHERRQSDGHWTP
ncbi:hypothetical protein [Actinacidiphila epipremni]|jgi:hypothetical protein|uniref:Uncharacterized protein n=1 Tax=Actinacidiphila epipremni TaxID=2053013 RepID=A0ABX0ZP70_9ACTN|nr:hypothetical protein [Actinacidiphila epipremni]NJP43411.1 hypothetical protein [Actinacidiphila epipremni]